MKTNRSIADEFLRDQAREEAEKIKAEAEKAEAEKAEAKARESELPVFTTKPMDEHYVEPVVPVRKETRGKKPLARIVCPFCEKEWRQKGAQAHIEASHGVSGFTVKDVFDVQDGVKSLENVTREKFDGDAEINLRNLSHRVSKEEFGSWDDIEDEDEAEVGSKPVDSKPVDSGRKGKDSPVAKPTAESKGGGSGLFGLLVLAGSIALVILSRTERGKEYADRLGAVLEEWTTKATKNSPGSPGFFAYRSGGMGKKW